MRPGRQRPDRGVGPRQGVQQLLLVRGQLVHYAHQVLAGPALHRETTSPSASATARFAEDRSASSSHGGMPGRSRTGRCSPIWHRTGCSCARLRVASPAVNFRMTRPRCGRGPSPASSAARGRGDRCRQLRNQRQRRRCVQPARGRRVPPVPVGRRPEAEPVLHPSAARIRRRGRVSGTAQSPSDEGHARPRCGRLRLQPSSVARRGDHPQECVPAVLLPPSRPNLRTQALHDSPIPVRHAGQDHTMSGEIAQAGLADPGAVDGENTVPTAPHAELSDMFFRARAGGPHAYSRGKRAR